MVELDVFPRGDVPLAQRNVLVRNISQAVKHICRRNSTGEFDAYHLDIGLALAVDTLPQPERCCPARRRGTGPPRYQSAEFPLP